MMTAFLSKLTPWFLWMHAHPYGVAAVTFVVVFLECLAVVGLFVPGTVLMVAIGALVGSGIIPLKFVLWPSIMGSFLGDVTSYTIGYHYQEHLREIWPFKFYPNLLKKGESFFYSHGGKGIFIGRFIGPIRPLLPIIAGMLNMKPVRFLMADGLSAFFWAPVCMFPGWLLGAASIALPPEMAMNLMLGVLLGLFIIWCISWLIKRFISGLFTRFHLLLDRLWRVIKNKPFVKPLNTFLQNPGNPENHTHLTLGFYFIVLTGTFTFLSWDVIHQGILTHWNMPLLLLLRSIRNPLADHIMLGFTVFGNTGVWFGVWAIILIAFAVSREWRTAGHWILLGLVGFGGAEIIKQIVHSPRPTGLWMTPSGYSFPSGHTAISTLVGGFLAVLLSRQLKKENRWIPYTVITGIVLCVASSRLYLGAHWLTDVIGGIIFGIAVIMLVTLSYFREETPKISAIKVSFIFLSAWIIIGTGYSVKYYKHGLTNYQLYIPAKTLTLKNWWESAGQDEPSYRENRVGKPVQVLNIQWAGNLEAIEENLIEQGWVISPNTTIGMILDRLSRPKHATGIKLPVLTQLYLDQHPVLVMTKARDQLVLRLWDGKTLFSDTDLPLWIGNVDYYHHSDKNKVLPVILFEKDLKSYVWKKNNLVMLIKPLLLEEKR